MDYPHNGVRRIVQHGRGNRLRQTTPNKSSLRAPHRMASLPRAALFALRYWYILHALGSLHCIFLRMSILVDPATGTSTQVDKALFQTATFGKEVIHLSSSTSLLLLMILNGAGVPGRLIPALLADSFFGSFNTLIPFVFCVSIALYCWTAVASVKSYIAFVIIYGICANAVQTLFPSTLSNLTTDITKMGVRTGMVFTICSLACLTGPPIAGVLIRTSDGTYRSAQLFGGTSVLLGAILILAARTVSAWRFQAPANH